MLGSTEVKKTRLTEMEFIMRIITLKQLVTMIIPFNLTVTEGLNEEATKGAAAMKEGSKQIDTLCVNSLHWEPIQSMNYKLLPIEPFTDELLPSTLYKYAQDNAARLDNAPAEYIAVAVIGAMSSLLGNCIRIRPKLHDSGWLESVNLWALVVGNPSTKKTPCLKAGMAPIKHLQKTDNSNLYNFIINDSTYQAACIKAEQNPTGILLFRDEIAGWLALIDKSGHSQERAFYLEGYSVADHEQIRINRDDVKIEDLTISVLGGTQPTKLLTMLRSRTDGTNNDGLFERFQLAVFPDTTQSSYTDIKPNEKVLNDVNRIFECLGSLRTPNQFKVFGFDHEAQNIWNTWAKDLKNLENSSEQDEQTVLGKYPALCAKIAVLLHLVSEAENCPSSNEFKPSLEISTASLDMAIKWVRLLWSHNKRIQHFGKYYGNSDKAELFLKRLRMIKNEPFELRDVYRGAMHGLKSAQEARTGATELIERGYLQQKIVQVSKNKQKVWLFRHPDLIKQMNK